MENSTVTQRNEYAVIIWTYVPPIVIIAGTFGNMLTIIAVTGRKITSFTVYLVALAVADTLVLYTQTFNLWLENILKIELKEKADILCKLHYFFIFLCPQISSWLVMCLTIERTICTFFSNKIRQFPGPRVGFTVVGLILFILCALNTHSIYGRILVSTENVTVCTFTDGVYQQFYYKYWTIINFLTYFVLPIIVIIFGNTLTSVKVYRSLKSVTSTLSSVSKTNTRHVFLMTLLVSVAFVVLVTPLPLLFIFNPVDTMEFPAAIFVHMTSLNHAINFFLYVLSGRRFREDLKTSIRHLGFRFKRSTTSLAISDAGTTSTGLQESSDIKDVNIGHI